jgi:hypothetical protein
VTLPPGAGEELPAPVRYIAVAGIDTSLLAAAVQSALPPNVLSGDVAVAEGQGGEHGGVSAAGTSWDKSQVGAHRHQAFRTCVGRAMYMRW